jgi:hypothetical protein
VAGKSKGSGDSASQAGSTKSIYSNGVGHKRSGSGVDSIGTASSSNLPIYTSYTTHSRGLADFGPFPGANGSSASGASRPSFISNGGDSLSSMAAQIREQLPPTVRDSLHSLRQSYHSTGSKQMIYFIFPLSQLTTNSVRQALATLPFNVHRIQKKSNGCLHAFGAKETLEMMVWPLPCRWNKSGE